MAFGTTLVIPAPARAAWPHEPNNGNVALCTAVDRQAYAKVVPDGAGGVIATWLDFRSGSFDIYAQRVNAAGVPQWTADGLAVCTATDEQLMPSIASDGAGGAIVAWPDYRDGTRMDIYAQRVSAAGVPQWAENGVALCSAPGGVYYSPAITSDGAGGAIVTWPDLRGGPNPDIYAQRVNAAGVPQWAANGVALCTATNDQHNPTIVTDGAGGAIVTWWDYRNGTNYDVYAQRVSAAGVPLWRGNGAALCTATSNQLGQRIASDGAGGAIVTWQDYRSGTNYDIYAQRVGAAGVPQWTAEGLALCVAADEQSTPTIALDGAGGAIVTWQDNRSGTSYDIYAQRVSAAGAAEWIANGVALCTADSSQYAPTIVLDGSGGAIVTWYDYRSGAGSDIYAQRVSAAGVPQWTADGVALSTATKSQVAPVIVSDGTGGAIVTWQDHRSGEADIYAQRIERFGQLGSPEPTITSVKDLPNDQGGRVKVSWAASYLDADPAFGVYDYRVWRSVPPQLLASGSLMLRRGVTEDADEAAAGGKLLVGPYATTDYAWEFVASTPSAISESYSMVVSVEGDSVAGWNPRTAFRIEARASSAQSANRWFSAPDSGYSVDNIAPVAPAPLTGFYSAGTTRLAWYPNREADLVGYRLYRGSSTSFVPGPGNLVSALPDTGYIDPAGAPYVYKLTAIDVHGNESPVATLVPSGTLDAPGAGAVSELMLSPVSPNPIVGEAMLGFALPRAGHVRLEVLDASGRRVAMVADGAFEAGPHSVRWQASGAGQQRLAPGVYLSRLSFEGLALTRRMIVTH